MSQSEKTQKIAEFFQKEIGVADLVCVWRESGQKPNQFNVMSSCTKWWLGTALSWLGDLYLNTDSKKHELEFTAEFEDQPKSINRLEEN